MQKNLLKRKKIEFDSIVQKLGQSIQQLADLISDKSQEYLNPFTSHDRHKYVVNRKFQGVTIPPCF